MQTPFTMIDRAFDPMFDEKVIVGKQTILACVTMDTGGEVLMDGMVDTEREDIVILCRPEDWGQVKLMQVGDRVRRPEANGREYAISSVDRDRVLGIAVRARSVD